MLVSVYNRYPDTTSIYTMGLHYNLSPTHYHYIIFISPFTSSPLCHFLVKKRHSGYQKRAFAVILATTASYLVAKTSQWSPDYTPKCSDAKKSAIILAS